MSKWTAVEEALPAITGYGWSDEVYIATPNGEVRRAWYNADGNWYGEGGLDENDRVEGVTHWQAIEVPKHPSVGA